MNKTWFILGILFFISNVYALCEENQIDINTASLGELDKLQGIGPVKAQAIIDARSFGSIDDLDRVNGIGNVTLNNIKSQGLACVDNDNNEAQPDKKEKIIEESYIEKVINNTKEEPVENNIKEVKEKPRIIRLNAQTIKSSENTELKTGNYMFYGLIGFCVLLGALFLLRRRKYKNEFKD
ncbi:MAG: helix-hairpin-helix domain-containing protein [Nanoarchaeota archaeon]